MISARRLMMAATALMAWTKGHPVVEARRGSIPSTYIYYGHRSITKAERARRNKIKKIAQASRRRNRRK